MYMYICPSGSDINYIYGTYAILSNLLRFTETEAHKRAIILKYIQ